MITIEEKINLFYKLLNQSLDSQLAEELKEIGDSYDIKLEDLKDNFDKEGKEIVDRANKKAQLRRTKSASKSKTVIQKEIMSLKETYYNKFMNEFKLYLEEFTDTKEYETYLSNITAKISEEIKNYHNTDLVIFVTKKDNEKYQDFIKKEINKSNSNKLIFKTSENIIGGLIFEFAEKHIKIDMSIDAVLEDNEAYIMATVFEALEVGDYND